MSFNFSLSSILPSFSNRWLLAALLLILLLFPFQTLSFFLFERLESLNSSSDFLCSRHKWEKKKQLLIHALSCNGSACFNPPQQRQTTFITSLFYFLYFFVPSAGITVYIRPGSASRCFTCLNGSTLNSSTPFLQRSALNEAHVNLPFCGADLPTSSVQPTGRLRRSTVTATHLIDVKRNMSFTSWSGHLRILFPCHMTQ